MSVDNVMKLLIKRLSPAIFLVCSLAFLTLVSMTAAYAISLDQAKSQGMVCELATGYLQATGSATGEVKSMAQNINTKRKAEYERIAKENGVKPSDVGALTAQKLAPKCK